MDNENDDRINFSTLEAELQAAIEEDAKYWRENDAKIRAVEQRVATYDEFRDMVKAAHLKPLDKRSSSQTKRGTIWNSCATSKTRVERPDSNRPSVFQMQEKSPKTTKNFVQRWRTQNTIERIRYMKEIGPRHVGQLLKAEIPVGMLGEIIEALLTLSSSSEDLTFTVQLLEFLTEANRFRLSLEFLNSKEKLACQQLMDKLSSCQQGAAELQKKFNVFLSS